MAALRKRRTTDENAAQEPAEEAQATLDFGSNEPETQNEQSASSEQTEAPAETSSEAE